jgi:nucleotide-binding universal stress UspA family protein
MNEPAGSDQSSANDYDNSDGAPGGGIVVGVDGSPGSLVALQWAAREARLRGAALRVVMAWQMPTTYGSANVVGLGTDPAMDAQAVLSEAAENETSRLGAEVDPDLDVQMSWEVVQGHPAKALIDAAASADLLVVGSRGHGGFVGALLGSVSQHVVTHASCPVVVIPDPQLAHHRQRPSHRRP